MTDRTATARVARQKERRQREGWHRVDTWVPTEAGKTELLERARQMRRDSAAAKTKIGQQET